MKYKKNNVLHCRLKNGTTIHGTIDKVTDTELLVDDDISGDIMYVNTSEIEEIYYND